MMMEAMTVDFRNAAQMSGISLRYLRDLDKRGEGPKVVRFGRKKRVLVDSLATWLKSREK